MRRTASLIHFCEMGSFWCPSAGGLLVWSTCDQLNHNPLPLVGHTFTTAGVCNLIEPNAATPPTTCRSVKHCFPTGLFI
ncbi:hypothetical protein BDZ91DRAFT_735775 [Kalaharituber pfeilii]|nr:hypothetical protein BDZ91DRAFT_735775 [Kalaharituber pfeilii]